MLLAKPMTIRLASYDARQEAWPCSRTVSGNSVARVDGHAILVEFGSISNATLVEPRLQVGRVEIRVVFRYARYYLYYTALLGICVGWCLPTINDSLSLLDSNLYCSSVLKQGLSSTNRRFCAASRLTGEDVQERICLHQTKPWFKTLWPNEATSA